MAAGADLGRWGLVVWAGGWGFGMCWLAVVSMCWGCSFSSSLSPSLPSPSFSPSERSRPGRLAAGKRDAFSTTAGRLAGWLIAWGGAECWRFPLLGADAGSVPGLSPGTSGRHSGQTAFVNITKCTLAIFVILTCYFAVSKQ